MSMHRLSGVLWLAPAAFVGAGLAGGPAAAAATPAVLRVGTYHGIAGTFPSIQAAVDAAKPGDWVLVGPGDHHERGSNDPEHPSGVLITTPSLHLRGMDRNGVIVDGTKPGGAACDSSPSQQDFGPPDDKGKPLGRNGILVFGDHHDADGVSVENLTVCNYLSSGSGANGNEVWWNGGDGSGLVGMGALNGAYLTASSSYNYATDPAVAAEHQKDGATAQAKYGIFTSNAGGAGLITHTYASNMGDSAYYIGACRDCNIDLNDAHAQNSALGFSGTNAGGRLVIENGTWDGNLAGIAPNTLNNDDWPSPADGACVDGTSPITGTRSCTVIRNNRVFDNNNPNTPSSGIAGAAPVGTGILLSGIRNTTVMGNTVFNHGEWGILVNDFPDTSTPPDKVKSPCAGGDQLGPVCYYHAFGNEVRNNVLYDNGTLGNPGDADLANVAVFDPRYNTNCYHGNVDPKLPGNEPSSDPPGIQALMGSCGNPGSVPGLLALAQLVCSSSSAVHIDPLPKPPACPAETNKLPAATGVTMVAIPHDQPTMPDPCAGVPINPWCPPPAAVVPPASGLAGIITTPDTGAGVPAISTRALAAGGLALATAGAGVAGRRRRARHN